MTTERHDLESGNLRRDFLRNAALGLTAAACGSAACSCGGKEKAEGEKVVLLSPEGELVTIDSSHLRQAPKTVAVSNEEARQGIPGRKFVMVIDLAKCKNARKCVTACQKMHHTPEPVEWLSVRLMKDSPDAAPYWFPKTCFHCDNPPCVKVCPVDATFKRQDGIVLIDADRCIGCKFCMAACPYSTRVFNWSEPEQSAEVTCLEYSPETSTPARVGTVEKCDFCPDKARVGELPDCVTACLTGYSIMATRTKMWSPMEKKLSASRIYSVIAEDTGLPKNWGQNPVYGIYLLGTGYSLWKEALRTCRMNSRAGIKV